MPVWGDLMELAALAELLTMLSRDSVVIHHWEHTYVIAAGTIKLALDLRPNLVEQRERDFILSFVAKLTNWTMADAEVA